MDDSITVLKARTFVRCFLDLALSVAMEPYVEKVVGGKPMGRGAMKLVAR